MEDEAIANVIQLKRESLALTTIEKCKESKEVRMFSNTDPKVMMVRCTDILLTSNYWFSRKN